MEQQTNVLDVIAEDLNYCINNCHSCPSDAVDEMVLASVEIRRNLATMAGTDPPDGSILAESGGVPVARLNLSACLAAVIRLRGRDLDPKTVDDLSNVYACLEQFRLGLGSPSAAAV